MSDFEDEEGVDEPVLDDENEDEGQEEEEVSVSKNLSYQYSCLLHIEQFETSCKFGFLRYNTIQYNTMFLFWRAF